MYFHFLLALGQVWTATPKHWAFSPEAGLFSQTALIESHYSSKWFKNPTGLNRTMREVKGRPVSSPRVGMVLQEVHHGLLEEQGLALILETKIKKQCQHRRKLVTSQRGKLRIPQIRIVALWVEPGWVEFPLAVQEWEFHEAGLQTRQKAMIHPHSTVLGSIPRGPEGRNEAQRLKSPH